MHSEPPQTHSERYASQFRSYILLPLFSSSCPAPPQHASSASRAHLPRRLE